MSDITAQTSSHDAVPCGLIHDVKFSFEDLGDVVEDPFLLEGVLAAVYGVLLHALTHISMLDHCNLRFLLGLLL